MLENDTTVPTIRVVHHVSLTVTDLARSASWYEALFGLVKVMDEASAERRAAVYRFPSGPLMLGLVEHSGAAGAGFDPRVVGLDHAAFTVGTREELDQWVARFDGLGIEHSGITDIPPGAILNFRDPDGIQLALFWDR